jgi:hypothetical protein
MRTVVIVLAALGTLSVTNIYARADGAWCAHYVNRPTNCGFNRAGLKNLNKTISGVSA